MKRRILVTGGCGFIGSNFVRHMLNKYTDYRIVNLDKMTYAGRGRNLKDIEGNSRYKFVKGDICDEKLVRRVVRDCDTIVNFAAESHVDRSIQDASVFVQTNVYGTYVLLEAAKNNKVGLFCQISTDEIYGSREEGFFKETDSLSPSSPYSASKAAADLLAQSFYVTHRTPVIIVRPTNNFGPFQYPEKVIPLFITNAIDGKKVPVYGDGRNVRDWLYVLDNCEAIDFALHKGKIGEVYNVAGNSQMKNIDLTYFILEIMDRPKSLIKFVEDRPGHDLRYALDSGKINKLGWRPRHNFEQALKEAIDWYCNNQKWWRPLKK